MITCLTSHARIKRNSTTSNHPIDLQLPQVPLTASQSLKASMQVTSPMYGEAALLSLLLCLFLTGCLRGLVAKKHRIDL